MSVTFPGVRNNFTTTLVAKHVAGSGKLKLSPGATLRLGDVLPSRPAWLTVASKDAMVNGLVVDPSRVTIFECTAIVNGELIVSRILDGTTDQTFKVGDYVTISDTAGLFELLFSAIGTEGGLSEIGDPATESFPTEVAVDEFGRVTGLAGRAFPLAVGDTVGGATEGRLPFWGASGVLSDSGALAFDPDAGALSADAVIAPTVAGGASPSGDILIQSTGHATKGRVQFNLSTTYVDSDGTLVLGPTGPNSRAHLYLGGATASFPQLMNVGADLYCQLADASGYARFLCGAIVGEGAISATGAASQFTINKRSDSTQAGAWYSGGGGGEIELYSNSALADVLVVGTGGQLRVNMPSFGASAAQLEVQAKDGSTPIFAGYVSTGGAAKFIIDATGKVGFGTTNPNNTLHVFGSSGYVAAFGDQAAGLQTKISANAVGAFSNSVASPLLLQPDGNVVLLGLTSAGASAAKFEVKAPDGSTPIFAGYASGGGTAAFLVRPNGAVAPPHLADSAAANDSIYYSTDASKLAYKDSGGVVNALY
jgi:hypothetical protein